MPVTGILTCCTAAFEELAVQHGKINTKPCYARWTEVLFYSKPAYALIFSYGMKASGILVNDTLTLWPNDEMLPQQTCCHHGDPVACVRQSEYVRLQGCAT